VQIYLRFYAELNDFLPPDWRYTRVPHRSDVHQTIGEVVEDCGVSLDKVEMILVNGESVDLSCEVNEGDRISVYPVFESFDISAIIKIRSKPLRQPQFVLDVHLGKLAYYMRMLGFDTLYRNDYRDDELIRIAVDEGRALLSKDRKLLADSQITRGYRVCSNHPPEQLIEALQRFDLFDCVSPFQRCIRCNVLLESAAKESVLEYLPPSVAQSFDEFQRCPKCHRVYWKGSHYARMESFISDILSSHREHPSARHNSWQL
jgi:uncharacterized protein with PIN domain